MTSDQKYIHKIENKLTKVNSKASQTNLHRNDAAKICDNIVN